MARLSQIVGSEWRLALSGGRRRFLCGDGLTLACRVMRRSVGESSRITRGSFFPWYASQPPISL
jgi:hypothetical protein